MTVAYRAGALANNGATSSTLTSAAFTVPAGVLDDDFGIVVMVINSNIPTISSAPSGWNAILSSPIDNSTAHRVWVYVKKLTAAEAGTTATWNITGSGRFVGIMDVFSGVDGTTPVEASASATAGAASSYNAPAVTSLTDLAGIYNAWAIKKSANPAATITVPGTHTADSYVASNIASGASMSIRGGHLTTPDAHGSHGTYAAATSSSTTGLMISLALKPASVPAGGGTMRRFNGTVMKTGGALQRWDGSTFKTGGTMRRFNGTDFTPAP